VTHPLLPRELQAAAVAVLLAFLAWLFHLIRHRGLSLRDSLLWIVSTLAVLAVTLSPETLRWAAHHLQIEVPSNALFALAILYLTFNLLSATIAISDGASRVRRLTQECTLLRAELGLLRERIDRVGGRDSGEEP
jgi:hypothetical protein